MSLEDRKVIPDVYPRTGWNAPWIRPESLRLFRMLPNIRPSVLYVVGDKSQHPKLKTNVMRLATTGTEWGGSGGVNLGRVKQVVVKNGMHLMILDRSLGEVADAAATWIQSEMKIWKELKTEHETSEWANKPDSEKFKVEDKLWRTWVGETKTSFEDILKGKL